MSTTQPIKCVILDWAGTAIDFGCKAPVIAFKYALEDFTQTPIDEQLIRRYMGLGKRDHIEVILKELHCEYTQQDLDDLVEELSEQVIHAAKDCSIIIDGLLEFQQSMKEQGIKLASNTGYTSEMMDPIKKLAKEQGYTPEMIVTSDQLENGRPHPEGCQLIADTLKINSGAEIIKIGDNTIDIEEGLNTKAWTIGVYQSSNIIGKSKAELFTIPDEQRESLLADAKKQLLDAGAHIVVPTIKEAIHAVCFIAQYHENHGNEFKVLQEQFESIN